MKSNLVILLSATLMCANGYSQGTGAGGGTGAGTGTPAIPGPGTRVTPHPIPPGTQTPPPQPVNPPLQQNPNLPQQGQTSPGQSSQFVGTNAGVTPLGVDTNQFGTNQVSLATNQIGSNLTPTAQPGFTNRILATNAPGLLTNQPLRDQALSETDRRLLGQIRTTVYGPSQVPAPLSGTVVNFILRDGVVRLVGVVPNAEEQKRIFNLVQQVPGVVRVYDALRIGVMAAPGQNPTLPGQTQK